MMLVGWVIEWVGGWIIGKWIKRLADYWMGGWTDVWIMDGRKGGRKEEKKGCMTIWTDSE